MFTHIIFSKLVKALRIKALRLFFLPLTLDKTLQTIGEISEIASLASPEWYIRLKALRLFFLPLTLDKTLQTIGEIGEIASLASPEWYIIVNGRLTKSRVVWHTLVDVNHLKGAVNKVKEIILLYKGIEGDTIYEAGGC